MSELPSSPQLAAMIEAEIVPRLLLSISSACRAIDCAQPQACGAGEADAAELARLLLAHDEPIARAFLDVLLDRGVLPRQLCLDVCAPAAQELLSRWEQRECDFACLERGLALLRKLLGALMSDEGSGERTVFGP